MNLAQAKELLSQLDRKDEQAEEVCGVSLTKPLAEIETELFPDDDYDSLLTHAEWCRYLIARIIHAESLHIPDLKEKVKAMCLAAMDAEYEHGIDISWPGDALKLRNEFRALCKPEVKP